MVTWVPCSIWKGGPEPAFPHAKENNMATSIQHDLVSTVEHEISCPICFEDFEEPKCLPNCAHNVCQQCLQGMGKKRNNVLECPVCRVESVIPKGGVAAFPKNHLLVRLIEQSPGRKEKRYLKETVKSYEEKLQGAKDALKEMEKRYVINIKTQCDEMKQRIQSLAERVVKTAREQEQKMLDEINLRFDQNEGIYKTLHSRAVRLCENLTNCIETMQGIVQNGELKDLRDHKDTLAETLNDLWECLDKRIQEANGKFTQPFDLSLTNTDLAEKFIDDVFSLGYLSLNSNQADDVFSLGYLSLNSNQAATSQSTSTAFVMPSWEACKPKPVTTSKVKDYSGCGFLIQRFGRTSLNFNAFSVAASRDCGNIVVVDDSTKFVHIFTEAGEKLNKFRIKHGDLWDIVVSNEDEIVVLNRSKNRLLHYNMNGNFQRKVVSAPEENVKFTSCSVDVHGRFIITSYPFYDDETEDDAKPCVLVYGPSGNLTMSFGEDDLDCPVKAVFLNGRFYVTDSGFGRVSVFDKTGFFVKTLEDEQLKSPSGIAADHSSGTLAVSDTDTLTVQIYSQAGQQLHCFQTENKPTDIAFTKNFKSLLVCFEVDDGNGYVEMLTYC